MQFQNGLILGLMLSTYFLSPVVILLDEHAPQSENQSTYLYDSIIKYKTFPPFYRDFLPRGSGIVTRRPLILQLINGVTGKLSI